MSGMRHRDKDAEVRAVTRELNDRMDELKAAVDQLNAILTGPPSAEAGERVTEPA